MIKHAALPILALVAACSAEVENVEAAEPNAVDTLSVENLVVTGSNTVAAGTVPTVDAPAAQPAERAEPVVEPAPRQQTVRKPSAEAAAKPATKPKAAPPTQPQAETEGSNTTCTAEHREMGHC